MDKAIKKRIEQIARGEAPEGYEKTAFGIFPCDWVKDSPLGSLFDFYGGLGKSRDELGEDGYPYLHYGDLHMGSFKVVSYNQYLQLPRCAVEIKGNDTYLMRDGDVAFLDASEDLTGTSRAVLIDNPSNEPFIAGLHIIYGHSKDDSLTKWYKQYITAETSVKKQFQKLAVGFKVYGINRNTLTKIKYSFPKSTEEQRKIADILMLWDKAIELKGKLIAEKDKQKQYLMDVLLTGKVRLPGFSDDWERVELKKVSTMCSGGTPSTENEEYYGGEYIWVSIADMTASAKYLTDSNKKLSELGLNNCSARLFPAGTVLFAMYASIGECVIAGKECATSQAILGITPDNKKLNNEFLYYALKQQQNKIVKMQQASSQPNLNKSLVESIIINVPSLKMLQKGIKEQEGIVKVLSMADAEIDALKEELILQRKQRDALMQLLLTGIVRVKYE